MKLMKITAVIFVGMFLISSSVLASPKGSGSVGAKGSAAMMEEAEAVVALEGFCPVAINKGMAMKGKDYFVTKYKGKIYKFANFDAQKAFLMDPEKFLENIDEKNNVVKQGMKGSLDKGLQKKGSQHKGSY